MGKSFGNVMLLHGKGHCSVNKTDLAFSTYMYFTAGYLVTEYLFSIPDGSWYYLFTFGLLYLLHFMSYSHWSI